MQRSDSTSAEHRCADWPLLDVFFPVTQGGEAECTGLMDVPRCCANNTDTTQGSEIIPQFERHPILVTLCYLVSETDTLNESKHKTYDPNGSKRHLFFLFSNFLAARKYCEHLWTIQWLNRSSHQVTLLAADVTLVGGFPLIRIHVYMEKHVGHII